MKTIENIPFVEFNRLILEQQLKIAELQIIHDWLILRKAVQPANLRKTILGNNDVNLYGVVKFLLSLLLK